MTAIIDPVLRAQRVQEIVASVTRRLRPLCGHMSEAEFQTMVQSMGERSYARDAAAPPTWWRGGGP